MTWIARTRNRVWRKRAGGLVGGSEVTVREI